MSGMLGVSVKFWDKISYQKIDHSLRVTLGGRILINEVVRLMSVCSLATYRVYPPWKWHSDSQLSVAVGGRIEGNLERVLGLCIFNWGWVFMKGFWKFHSPLWLELNSWGNKMRGEPRTAFWETFLSYIVESSKTIFQPSKPTSISWSLCWK